MLQRAKDVRHIDGFYAEARLPAADTIVAGRVAVPTCLYKLVYAATTGRSWRHWQENRPGRSLDRR